ncbi:glutaredoxin family protein [Candidatus Saccharibacteria bacterium]|nr:glutaredoxin family protein [Candidatus Saccharibacteria bacterium]
MNVKVYSADWCGYCHAEMEWLDELGVEYEEINADGLNLEAIPVTEIDGEQIVGFDRPAILKALKKAGFSKK